MHWICSQIGAREHYAIPRVLYREGKLDSLYTDFWSRPWWRKLGNLTGTPNLTARFHPDLPEAKVKSFDLTTLTDSIMGDPRKSNPYDWFLYVGSDFGRSVLESLKRKKGVKWSEIIFFGYDTGFLEPARWVKARGGKAVVCQMDPSRTEVEMIQQEKAVWQGWSKRSAQVPEDFFLRREAEWAVADLIIVNSEWSLQALIAQGVKEEKIVIIPLAYEMKLPKNDNLGEKLGSHASQSPVVNRAELRVLFLGQVILRKGIQYLIEAAKVLKDEAVHFDVVGTVGISEDAIKSAPSNMTFHGATARDDASKFFRSADIFVLPTLSDGFAITQLEAMACGLPVITTPNCGEVVTHGVDGFIVPAKDSNRLAEAICLLAHDPEKVKSMGLAARGRVKQFSLSRLGKNLALLEQRLICP